MDDTTGSSNTSRLISRSTNNNEDIWSEEEDPAPVYENRERRCLACHESFESAWSGERICRNCKAKASWRSGWL